MEFNPHTSQKSPRRPLSEVSLLEVLHEDHERTVATLDVLKKVDDAEKSQSLLTDLQNEIQSHRAAEAETIFTALDSKQELKARAQQANLEHDRIQECLDRLKEQNPEAGDWMMGVGSLDEAIRHHIQITEVELFDQLQQSFSSKDLEEMKTRFLLVKSQSKERQAAA